MTHPSEHDIQRWLDTGKPAGVDQHVSSCDTCAATADRLSGEPVVERLRKFLAAPEGFEDRVARRVDVALSRWDALETLAGMFTVGLHAAGIMIGEGPDEQ